jgi:DNA-binding response OmpR family regulator
MVYGIVTQNGGQIAVESSVGRGTVFTITFPATSLEPPRPGQSWRPGDGTPASGTILLVEDDPAVRHITARFLRRHGYTVLEASRPSEARAISETDDEIDLLLADLVMPEMSGAKLAEELMLQHPKLKVLYMTGYAGATVNHPHIGVLAHEDRVIAKPFTSDALLDRVRATLLGSTTVSH